MACNDAERALHDSLTPVSPYYTPATMYSGHAPARYTGRTFLTPAIDTEKFNGYSVSANNTDRDSPLREFHFSLRKITLIIRNANFMHARNELAPSLSKHILTQYKINAPCSAML
jgi:hypothetical protein